MFVWLAELLEVIGPWLTRLALAHAAFIFVKVLATLGLALFTYEEIIAPIRDHVLTAMGQIPSQIAVWMGALGIDKAVSITIAAYTISAAKRMALGKSA